MKKKAKKEVKEDSPRIKELKHKARRHSIKEGIFATVHTSLGSNYISPFAIAINTSNSMVALLGSIGGLLSPLTQLFSSRLMEKHSRKKMILKSVFLEALMWIPFILIAFLFYKRILLNLLPIFLIIAFAIQIILQGVIIPAWFSWLGDIVDSSYRGRWFAKRNLIIGFISIILTIAASFFLDYFGKKNFLMLGFAILFFLAMIGRFISWKCFRNKYEPKIQLNKEGNISFWKFLINSPKNNFGRFTLFRFFLSFSQSIIAPLIAVYLLRTLGFGYAIYMIIMMAGTFFSLTMLGLWGKIADRLGNYYTITISSAIIPIIPILWILHTSPLYLIIVPSIVGGIAWAGFNLATGNFIYDNVSSEKRGFIVPYYNLLIGIGIFLGAGLGAILIKYLEITFIEPIVFIFILSGILRFFTVLIGIPKIEEVKDKKDFQGSISLKNLILEEAKQTLSEEAHQIMSIKEYVFEK